VLLDADRHVGDWISHGRNYAETRYSPLDEINSENVGDLKLLWTFPTGLTRGHEATPIVVNGILYFTGSWSVLFAVDAKTGDLLWKYDPEVPKETAQKGCCDVVNRGVAIYEGNLYLGTYDGRLVAVDAKTGKPVWEKLTVDLSKPYTITGAPRIVKGKVIIGNGGAELGVRGYVSAYDAKTGDLAWRTYTVPGNPADGFESKALEQAAKTWKGGQWWKIGGGGTAWDSMAFDPELDLLYVGTGNGSPWVRHIRSPGGGDNLYLSSILALNPDNGELVWHYQTTPGDTWDFTATQHMILADLEIDGEIRPVIRTARRNRRPRFQGRPCRRPTDALRRSQLAADVVQPADRLRIYSCPRGRRWDPVAKKEVWRHPYALAWNGGTLATGGNLVFQGTADGRFVAYSADTGKQRWEDHAGSGIIAAPVTYTVDGKQYVSILAGWGGAFALAAGDAAKISGTEPWGQLLTFALPDEGLPPASEIEDVITAPGRLNDGQRLYHSKCAVCHGANGVSGGTSIPDLRNSRLPYQAFDMVVREGLLEKIGMPSFAGRLTAADTRLIRDYLDSQKATGG